MGNSQPPALVRPGSPALRLSKLAQSAMGLLVLAGCDANLGNQLSRLGWNWGPNATTVAAPQPPARNPIPHPNMVRSRILPRGPVKTIREDDPREVAGGFLVALQRGDPGVARALLTTKAQAALAEQNLETVTPGSQLAFFHIGDVAFVQAGTGAHVTCAWSDKQADGRPLTLVLRREQAGLWRVAGLVAETDNSHEIFDFESPQEMLSRE